MKAINFLNSSKDEGGVKELLSYMWSIGALYDQVKRECRDRGYYLPQDQWDVYTTVFNIQASLEIGERQKELNNWAY